MTSDRSATWQSENAAIQIDGGIWMLDLGFQNRAGIVAAWLIEAVDKVALIETGPGSTLPNLEAALHAAGRSLDKIDTIIVTHIHLDHAGAAGSLARLNPNLKICVHPFGAPHLVEPSKLIASATRIYGDQMESLWGEFLAVPAEQVVSLEDRQVLQIAERQLEIHFTPGHAWHHVAIWDKESGGLITGDAAGVRMPGSAYVCPPTPPPDLAIDAWHDSITRMRSLKPSRLLLTHFGPVDDPDAHFDLLESELVQFLQLGETAFVDEWSLERLSAALHERMLTGSGEEFIDSLELATPSHMAAMGLSRFFSKRSQDRAGT